MSLQDRTCIQNDCHGVVYRESKNSIVKRTSMWNVKDMIVPYCFDHPNIINVNKLTFENRYVNISMEQDESCDVVSDLLNYIKQILSGLLFLHSNRIIHQNMNRISTVKSGDIYKIIDFGSAKLQYNTEECPTTVGLNSAPEMIGNSKFVTYNSDVYMFGLALRAMMYDTDGLPVVAQNSGTDGLPVIAQNLGTNMKIIKHYVKYQHSILGNGRELSTVLGLENSADFSNLPDVVPRRFDNPDVEYLVTMMTTVDINKRPSVKQLLSYKMFIDIPYNVSRNWYTSYPHVEPQYHSIADDNRTDIGTIDINRTNERLYETYIYNAKAKLKASDFVVIELACSLLQRSMKRFMLQRSDLETYMFMSLTIANSLINTGSNNPEGMNKDDVYAYTKIMEEFGTSILSGSLTTYLLSEYTIDDADISKVVTILINIWMNPNFVQIRSHKKCVVAIGVAKYGKSCVVPDDIDMRQIFEYLTKNM